MAGLKSPPPKQLFELDPEDEAAIDLFESEMSKSHLATVQKEASQTNKASPTTDGRRSFTNPALSPGDDGARPAP